MKFFSGLRLAFLLASALTATTTTTAVPIPLNPQPEPPLLPSHIHLPPSTLNWKPQLSIPQIWKPGSVNLSPIRPGWKPTISHLFGRGPQVIAREPTRVQLGPQPEPPGIFRPPGFVRPSRPISLPHWPPPRPWWKRADSRVVSHTAQESDLDLRDTLDKVVRTFQEMVRRELALE
jgi:hypothetical protein